MEGQHSAVRQPPNLSQFSRPIGSERDYREAKSLLSLTMRTARDSETAIRAEALLREIVDYEIRLDGESAEDWSRSFADGDDYEGPRRRWSDLAGD